MKNCSVPIARNSSKSRQALVPTSLKYNLRGIIVSIIKGSFFSWENQKTEWSFFVSGAVFM